jgi:hypothetical protein
MFEIDSIFKFFLRQLQEQTNSFFLAELIFRSDELLLDCLTTWSLDYLIVSNKFVKSFPSKSILIHSHDVTLNEFSPLKSYSPFLH